MLTKSCYSLLLLLVHIYLHLHHGSSATAVGNVCGKGGLRIERVKKKKVSSRRTLAQLLLG